MTSQIEFLKTGYITWVSKSGKTETRQHVKAGHRMMARVVHTEHGTELWDGNWSVLMPADAIKEQL